MRGKLSWLERTLALSAVSIHSAQKLISILLAVGLLANQLAVIPHAHSAKSVCHQSKQFATPHLHLKWLSILSVQAASECQRHQTSSCHQGDLVSDTAPQSVDDPLAHGIKPPHDSDAIYLPHAGAPIVLNKNSTAIVEQSILVVISVLSNIPMTCAADRIRPVQPNSEMPDRCPTPKRLLI